MQLRTKLWCWTVAAFLALYSIAPNVLASEDNRKKKDIYPAKKSELSLEYLKYDVNLGKKIQTTPVHPDDSSFLSGETTTDVGGTGSVGLKYSLEGSIGNEWLRGFVKGALRYNALSSQDEYKRGIYDTKQQESDTRHPSSGSFVFTHLDVGLLTFIPSAGLEAKLSEKFLLSAEYGFPYMGFEARSGHDRFGAWQTVQKDSWDGFGRMWGLNLTYIPESERDWTGDKWSFNVYYMQEKYTPNFAGEDAKIQTGVFGLGLVHKF